MKLYEVANDYLALMQAIDNDELPEEAIADTLEAIKGEIEVKADNIACLLKNIEADITAFKAEESRLAERRKVKEKAHERLKQYLSNELQRLNIDKVETARNNISFRKSESVELDEETFIAWASEYRDDLLTYSNPKANKTEIKKALKDGAEIVGASLISKNNIQIK
ncbi:MAG: siphovirus Gp157 family protein [Clostridia bacterium]|nr:siphovirus Gp157 family protein [Clostridia bacterium]